jgi:hypothetical protein
MVVSRKQAGRMRYRAKRQGRGWRELRISRLCRPLQAKMEAMDTLAA